MQGLRFLCEEFYFLQRFKHALPIIDYKFAREKCKVLAFCAKSFSFYRVLNTLYQSLIKNLCGRCKVFAFYTKNRTFYIVLNTPYLSSIKNSRVKDARSVFAL